MPSLLLRREKRRFVLPQARRGSLPVAAGVPTLVPAIAVSSAPTLGRSPMPRAPPSSEIHVKVGGDPKGTLDPGSG